MTEETHPSPQHAVKLLCLDRVNQHQPASTIRTRPVPQYYSLLVWVWRLPHPGSIFDHECLGFLLVFIGFVSSM